MTKIRNILFMAVLILITTSCTNPLQQENQNNLEQNISQEKLPQDFDSFLALFGKTTDTTGNVINLQAPEIYLGQYKLQITFQSNQSTTAKGAFAKGTYKLFNTDTKWDNTKPVTYNLDNLIVVNNDNGKIETKTIAAIVEKKEAESTKIATNLVEIKYITKTTPKTTIEEAEGSTTINFIIDIEVIEK